MTPLSQPFVSNSALGGNQGPNEHLPGFSDWLLLQEGKGQRVRLQGQPVWCLWRQLQRAALPGRRRERWRSVINKGIDFSISAFCILLA